MHRFNALHAHAMYYVGGRLYKTICLTPTSLRLKDLLDGQHLSFTRDEACQMIQQQDLIKITPSTLRRLSQTDLRYRPYLTACEQKEHCESWSVSTAQRVEHAQRPPPTPRNLADKSGPLRKAVVERQGRCTTFFSGPYDGLNNRPHCSPGDRVQMILLDEFIRITSSKPLQTQILALLERLGLMLSLCPYSNYILRFSIKRIVISAPLSRRLVKPPSASSRHCADFQQPHNR